MIRNSFQTHQTLEIGSDAFSFHSLKVLEKSFGEKIRTLPVSLCVLLENLLRYEDGKNIRKQDIEALINWNPSAIPEYEIQFTPGRVLLQDFTGVPVIADLTAMRSELERQGGNPMKINPLQPVDLVIDHSVQVDSFGKADSIKINTAREFERNHERYQLLKWAQKSFKNLRVVPPSTGICHQVNLEHLSPVVTLRELAGDRWLFPDTVFGTDSHTPMINGLGVLGWGVGGIEAEAAMLGQPSSLLIPQVIGVRLVGQLPIGVTATDLVLNITEVLRKKGVVGKFVEYFGSGISKLSIADRATVSNMSPEYGATVGLFPVDERSLEYMRMTGRGEEAKRAEVYFRAQNLFFDPQMERRYSDIMEIDLGTIQPSIAGPARPQDRWNLSEGQKSWQTFFAGQPPGVLKSTIDRWTAEGGGSQTNPGQISKLPPHEMKEIPRAIKVELNPGSCVELTHGCILIAAITSCTNTSNPSLMIGAGLIARNALQKNLTVKPWVKTSFAPGSQVVTDYLQAAGFMKELDGLHFNLVGYGCTTCIGNSGPLAAPLVQAIERDGLLSVSVLSGNRNFEARINPLVSANYLMSPPLVVAYALVGHMDINLTKDPLGQDQKGEDVFLRDIWPDPLEVEELVRKVVDHERFERIYKNISIGSEEWRKIEIVDDLIYRWKDYSTYIQEPPFPALKPNDQDFTGGRVLGLFGDSITTDHISPAGSFNEHSPAGRYLQNLGVKPKDFNSYGSRRGNHQVMWRGTFANVRLQNKLVPDKKGGWTIYFPKMLEMNIFDAAEAYAQDKIPLVIIAGKEYGSGSSRDWAAKGVRLLGVKAILAESFERIHRSNLVGMGVAPLEFLGGTTAISLGLSGSETISILGLGEVVPRGKVSVTFEREDGFRKKVEMISRIDTPNELKYFRSGGVLPYILHQLSHE
jgi:aconitate hydratase